MRILELFSGYGTASFALKRLGIDYELVGYSDIDKYANQCFKQNHCADDIDDRKRLDDVTKVDASTLPNFDLLTGGFPCQAFSVAGQMKGELDPRGTLFYEIIRIAEVKQPKYMLLENVKGLTSKKFKDTFDKILSELDRIGYVVYWKVLNSKDYGIPQSRARVWFVCFRKDVQHTFEWPQPKELDLFIKDILEDKVDSKYYLSEKLQERFFKYLEGKESKICAMRGRNPDNPTSRQVGLPTEQMIELQKEPISNTISTVQKDNLVIQLDSSGKEYRSQNDRLYPTDGCMTAIPSNGASNKCNIYDNIMLDSRKYQGESEPRVYDGVSPTLMARARADESPIVGISNCSPREVGFQTQSSPTLCARDYKDPKIVRNGSLRRLTPKECFRLMGFLNDEINLDGLSDTQRYKLAGNGQDVNMVTKIFERML